MKSEQWFLDRIGQRIYRETNGCKCFSCKTVFDKGLIINDKEHARYLFLCQNEMGIKYFDKDIDTNE